MGDSSDVNVITTISDFGYSFVTGGTGDFSGVGVFTPVIWGEPLVFVSPVSINNPLWSVGGFSFELTTLFAPVRIDNPAGTPDTLTLSGLGTITRGADSVSGGWSWSGELDGRSTFSFSSTTIPAVPDGASTLLLLGLALLGVTAAGRKKA